MQTGRSVVTDLLADYAFVDYIFKFFSDSCAAAEIERSLAL